jgi:putative tryptophan/tyrosine transport system substrate-binding protein
MRWRLVHLFVVVCWLLGQALSGPSAQAQSKVHRVGHLALAETSVEATVQVTLPALRELGFESGRNLVFEPRTGAAPRLGSLATELVALRPDVVITIGTEALKAMREATENIPIVSYGADPVTLGYAQSFSRPAGNVTGVMIHGAELDGKRLELLQRIIPSARAIASLRFARAPSRPESDRVMAEVAAASGVRLVNIDVAGRDDYPAAFAAMKAAGAQGLVITSSSALFADTALLAEMAIDARLPTVCEWTVMARAGCLAAYGPNQLQVRARLATFVARILAGASPADLPIEQPTTFEVAINQRTAKALELAVPVEALARADEVIE